MAAKTKASRAKKSHSRLTQELLETARDMRASGIITEAAHEKITLRHTRKAAPAAAVTLTGREIKALREAANLSQAVFARYLHLTTGYVSQLERGAKRPTGPALVLLDVIRRKGIEAIL
ncbi:MAG TPA: helix-turn-helix domain-containing protein [Bradyrhizobium sp.]|nr:helix-turn-helix domain-containing protein [Bradyrhizobium sp.]